VSRRARPAYSIPDEGNEARVLGGGFIQRSERGAEAETMLKRLALAGETAAA
jgi:tRNA-specific 2-thiouridylase